MPDSRYCHHSAAALRWLLQAADGDIHAWTRSCAHAWQARVCTAVGGGSISGVHSFCLLLNACCLQMTRPYRLSTPERAWGSSQTWWSPATRPCPDCTSSISTATGQTTPGANRHRITFWYRFVPVCNVGRDQTGYGLATGHPGAQQEILNCFLGPAVLVRVTSPECDGISLR